MMLNQYSLPYDNTESRSSCPFSPLHLRTIITGEFLSVFFNLLYNAMRHEDVHLVILTFPLPANGLQLVVLEHLEL